MSSRATSCFALLLLGGISGLTACVERAIPVEHFCEPGSVCHSDAGLGPIVGPLVDGPRVLARCGDGTRSAGELCDDGNGSGGDGCDTFCQLEPGFSCAGEPSTCSTMLGDGVAAGGESCDDGNRDDGDGCDSAANVEHGFSCAGTPSVCATVCGDGIVAGHEACDDANLRNIDGCSSECEVFLLPASCEDWQALEPAASDGAVTLYFQHDELKPWSAYCAEMSRTPKAYLILQSTDAGHNFSQYTSGGAVFGTNARTSYTRIRIDPVTLRVDTADETFSSSIGSVDMGGNIITAMPFATAANCNYDDSSPDYAGIANVDLTGTPFVVESEFYLGGYMTFGDAVFGAGGRTVDLRVYGYCGWLSADSATNGPYNQSGGSVLQLRYGG